VKKVVLIISICIVIVFSSVALIVAFVNEHNGMGDAVANKETALKIGRALLEEHFDDMHWDDVSIDAEERNGIWKVYNVVQRKGTTADGNVWAQKGGGLYVEFRKDNGKVVKIGIND